MPLPGYTLIYVFLDAVNALLVRNALLAPVLLFLLLILTSAPPGHGGIAAVCRRSASIYGGFATVSSSTATIYGVTDALHGGTAG
eukprot:703162-Rhodomonas_salina.1